MRAVFLGAVLFAALLGKARAGQVDSPNRTGIQRAFETDKGRNLVGDDPSMRIGRGLTQQVSEEARQRAEPRLQIELHGGLSSRTVENMLLLHWRKLKADEARLRRKRDDVHGLPIVGREILQQGDHQPVRYIS